jgi:hypothetical protein
MALPLRPNEQVVYPQPYEEAKYNPLVVSTERLFQINQTGGILQTDIKTITGVGRGVDTRIVGICALLILLGLPLAIYGLVTWRGADKALADPAFKEGCPKVTRTSSVKVKQEAKRCENAKSSSIKGIVFIAIGGLCGVGAFFLFKKRLTVIVGVSGRIATFKAKDKNQQSQMLMTIQSMVNSAKQTAATMAAAQAAAKQPPRR